MVSFNVGANRAESTRRWRPLLINESTLPNKMVASSITINITTSINKRPQSQPLLINVYVNIQSIQTTNRRYSQQWCGLEDAILHLQLPMMYLIGDFLRQLLDAAATAGSCDGLPVRPAIWRKMLLLFELLFFPYISNKPRSQRESCLFSTSAWHGPVLLRPLPNQHLHTQWLWLFADK